LSFIEKYDSGAWRIESKIGNGSFGTVYEISNEDGEKRHAALKVIPVPTSDSLGTLRSEGFIGEKLDVYLRALVDTIMHEIDTVKKYQGVLNIVSYEHHEIVKKDDEPGYYILLRMELLTSLEKVCATRSITERDAVKLGIDICCALEALAVGNTVHRDVKPDNILVTEDNVYKLADFGTAKNIDRSMAGQSVKGTYNYMAPEVFKGQKYGTSVDMYSLGLVMYKLLNNNRMPFISAVADTFSPSDRDGALAKRMQGIELPSPAFASEEVAGIILKACAFKREDRFETATDMKVALEGLIIPEGEEEVIPYGSSTDNVRTLNPAKKSHFAEAHYEPTVGASDVSLELLKLENADGEDADLKPARPEAVIQDAEYEGTVLEDASLEYESTVLEDASLEYESTVLEDASLEYESTVLEVAVIASGKLAEIPEDNRTVYEDASLDYEKTVLEDEAPEDEKTVLEDAAIDYEKTVIEDEMQEDDKTVYEDEITDVISVISEVKFDDLKPEDIKPEDIKLEEAKLEDAKREDATPVIVKRTTVKRREGSKIAALVLGAMMVVALVFTVVFVAARNTLSNIAFNDSPMVAAAAEPDAEPSETEPEIKDALETEPANEAVDPVPEALPTPSIVAVTEAPTEEPTEVPTEEPTEAPTEEVTEAPTEEPTEAPTLAPTSTPKPKPTPKPTAVPTPRPNSYIEINGQQYEAAVSSITLNGTGAERSELERLYLLPNLASLTIKNCGLTDAGPLSTLKTLTFLDLTENLAKDAKPLAGLGNLTELRLGHNQFEDISALSGLKNLKALELYSNKVRDANPLSGLSNLERLQLEGNEISDAKPLAGLSNLRSLNLAFNRLTGIGSLAETRRLTFLNVSFNEISDISCVSNMPDLEEFRISGNNKLTNASPLANHSKLRTLYIDGNNIIDVSPLASLSSLKVLSVKNNPIIDVKPLSNLKSLTTLYISGAHIEDPSPLAQLTNLTVLEIYDNPISDTAINDLRRAMPNCEIKF
jgi:serine/threonine protein kinase/Leucine-rich repeat (LRR) protein